LWVLLIEAYKMVLWHNVLLTIPDAWHDALLAHAVPQINRNRNPSLVGCVSSLHIG
jgi:hypothetical protein